MPKKVKKEPCCENIAQISNYKVDSLVSVDERGQMVLPKELREKAGIKPGDKLAVVTWEKDGEVCCLSLIKVEKLTEMVKDILGPMAQEMMKKED